jgi:hypothetical protein
MAGARARARTGRVHSAVRLAAVSDLLVLAAIERAECHQRVEGVLWGHIAMHLGAQPAAATTRKLRPQVNALIEAGAVRQSRRGGCKVWGLTAAGRARLSAARQAGEVLELPEAPQHREWRRARTKAEGEIEWLRDQLQSALELAQGSLLDERADATAWLRHGERVQEHCAQLAVAYYCLHQWPEPADAQPDGAAIRGWSRSLSRGTIEPSQGDSAVLAGRLRLVRGANGG